MKTLEHYLSLKYSVEINKIPEELGGGYNICIPLLGRDSVVGDGETLEEALQDLEESKKDFFEDCLKDGIVIPEPVQEEQETYSGKFLVRMSKDLHRLLALYAKQNDLSLNQYVIQLLSLAIGGDLVDRYLTFHTMPLNNWLLCTPKMTFTGPERMQDPARESFEMADIHQRISTYFTSSPEYRVIKLQSPFKFRKEVTP